MNSSLPRTLGSVSEFFGIISEKREYQRFTKSTTTKTIGTDQCDMEGHHASCASAWIAGVCPTSRTVLIRSVTCRLLTLGNANFGVKLRYSRGSCSQRARRVSPGAFFTCSIAEHSAHEDRTTSLLAEIRDVGNADLRHFIALWLNYYLFSGNSGGSFQVPISVGEVHGEPAISFYATDGSLRGSLVFACRPTSSKLIAVLHVMSECRFKNPSGFVSASLPGERRIIRKVFTAVQEKFGDENTTVKYKVSASN